MSMCVLVTDLVEFAVIFIACFARAGLDFQGKARIQSEM